MDENINQGLLNISVKRRNEPPYYYSYSRKT